MILATKEVPPESSKKLEYKNNTTHNNHHHLTRQPEMKHTTTVKREGSVLCKLGNRCSRKGRAQRKRDESKPRGKKN